MPDLDLAALRAKWEAYERPQRWEFGDYMDAIEPLIEAFPALLDAAEEAERLRGVVEHAKVTIRGLIFAVEHPRSDKVSAAALCFHAREVVMDAHRALDARRALEGEP